MAETPFPLRVVDGLALPPGVRDALRPGATVEDAQGRQRALPRYFYEIPSWDVARQTALAPDFGLHEFIHVDLHEAAILQRFPRYVPCAVTLLAAHLSLVRQALGTFVHVAANGGYRSPAHRRTTPGALDHAWGTAANLYRIGDDFLDTPEALETYAARLREVLPGVWIAPPDPDALEDHLHLSLGFVTLTPPDLP